MRDWLVEQFLIAAALAPSLIVFGASIAVMAVLVAAVIILVIHIAR